MSSLFPFLIIGLTSGALYGLAGTGLVLTYKTSGVFNFAHGAIATVTTYVFYVISVSHGLSWQVAAFISVFVIGPIIGLLMEQFARRLAVCTTAIKIVGTLGIVLLVQALASAKYGTTPRPIPTFLPQDTIQVGSQLTIGYDQLIIIGISLVSVVGLYTLLRRTRLGTAMRAVVDNPELLDQQGINPRAVRRASWIIGSTFASLSGVLLAPNVGLDALLLTLLVVQAFGAAAIGAFSSLPMTYVGGLVIGLASSITTKYIHGDGFLAGLPPSIPFIALFLVLVLMPKSKLVDRRVTQARPQPTWRAPARIQIIGGGLFFVLLVIAPAFAGARLTVFTAGLTSAMLFLSLGLLVKTSGQVSLAHAGFAAVGAAAFSHLMSGTGLPWLLAVLVAGLVAVPVGAFIAIPAIRLSGLYLALATFGFGIVLEQMFYTRPFMFSRFTSGVPAPRPHLSWLSLDSDKGYYYVVLAMVVFFAAGVVMITRMRLGRLLRAMSDSPLALSTMGVSLNVTRVMVFCLSAYIAAISGALTASLSLQISGQSFASFTSLTMFVLLMIVGGGVPWYAFQAGIGLSVIPTFFSGINVTYYFQALFGFSAILIAIQGGQPAGADRIRHLVDRLGGRKPALAGAAGAALQVSEPKPRVAATRASGLIGAGTVASAVESPKSAAPKPGRTGLKIENLTVRYGGAVAVNSLNLEAPTGRITGLIGPNGAGKTTSFNACSGLVRPSEGKVYLHGKDVTSVGSPARARLGLGRTFQKMELFDSLTVRENVALGVEATMAGKNPLRQLAARRSDRILMGEQTEEAISRCGLGDLAELQAGLLSTGQRRLVELARCLVGPYDMLLLDEPSSGLDSAETAVFGEILCRTVAERGLGILLVEHDMSLVLSVCNYLYVLDFGQLIEEGNAAQISNSDAVRKAYLGDDDVSDYVQSQPSAIAVETA
ncbi:ABC transporter permease subunit [Jatrophihabitans sp. DSM 45814]